MLEIIQQINWLDIFIIILLFRISYIAAKTGVPVESFKLLGTVVSIYLALHYYTNLSDLLTQRASLNKERVPLEFIDFLSFVSLAAAGYLIILSFRVAFARFIKMEATPNLNRWLGLALGVIRGLLLVSLITFTLAISSSGYLKKSVANSYFGRRLFNTAPEAYSWLWNKVTSKFMPSEKFNDTVSEVQKSFNL
ncbi:MAG: CvpA family protein [Candidatus Omnitrophota bacterium]